MFMDKTLPNSNPSTKVGGDEAVQKPRVLDARTAAHRSKIEIGPINFSPSLPQKVDEYRWGHIRMLCAEDRGRAAGSSGVGSGSPVRVRGGRHSSCE